VTVAEATNDEAGFWYLSTLDLNLGKHVSVLALQLFLAAKIQSPDSLSAIYVRPSDAELNQCR